jgi:hypothetical protein
MLIFVKDAVMCGHPEKLGRNLRYVQNARVHIGMSPELRTERLKKRRDRRRVKERQSERGRDSDFTTSSKH